MVKKATETTFIKFLKNTQQKKINAVKTDSNQYSMPTIPKDV